MSMTSLVKLVWNACCSQPKWIRPLKNHNLETVPRLYKQCRPGADYANSLKLLKDFKADFPHIPTKSGLMLGLGETDEEIMEVLHDLRRHNVEMLTIGQYLSLIHI